MGETEVKVDEVVFDSAVRSSKSDPVVQPGVVVTEFTSRCSAMSTSLPNEVCEYCAWLADWPTAESITFPMRWVVCVCCQGRSSLRFPFATRALKLLLRADIWFEAARFGVLRSCCLSSEDVDTILVCKTMPTVRLVIAGHIEISLFSCDLEDEAR